MRCPARLPESTAETYGGSSTRRSWRSYQFIRCPRTLVIFSTDSSACSSRSSISWPVMKPRSLADTVANNCRPMFVGDVRVATTGCGVSWKLSGTSQCVLSLAKCSKKVQCACASRMAMVRSGAVSSRSARTIGLLKRCAISGATSQQSDRIDRSTQLPVPSWRDSDPTAIAPSATAASATAGHIRPQTMPRPLTLDCSTCDAVCHSSSRRCATCTRCIVRTIASAATSA